MHTDSQSAVDVLPLHCLPLVRFYYSSASKENLYNVMNYILGGVLFSLLCNVGAL